MKERPILFSGPMVRALLEGRKTQTRRVVKYKNIRQTPPMGKMFSGGFEGDSICPYGQPGDRLYVRETWKQAFPVTDYSYGVIYAADKWQSLGMAEYCGGWKPSIHMPRWASRITLEIVSVRVERVLNISEADARAEGVEPEIDGWNLKGEVYAYWKGFAILWDSINKKRGFGWEKNPWVWIIEFKRIQP